MEALVVILVLIIIALVILCLKLNKERKPAPKEQIVIEVCRFDDGNIHKGRPRYRACIKDNTEIFSTGDTFYDAVGDLVNSNRELFKVEYLGKLPDK